MSLLFEELDDRSTPIGSICLRRRRDFSLGVDVFEIKPGEEHLMSSIFIASEVAMAALPAEGLDVAAGGLGLGYTAQAVLKVDRVVSLTVVEILPPVIEWHNVGILPLGRTLLSGSRCTIVQEDFIALAASDAGLDPARPGQRFHAILVNIDHSPKALLNPRSEGFYRPDGLRQLLRHLRPNGVFALWSDDQPDPAFLDRLSDVVAVAWAEPVAFRHPVQDLSFTQAIYLARSTVDTSESAD